MVSHLRIRMQKHTFMYVYISYIHYMIQYMGAMHVRM